MRQSSVNYRRKNSMRLNEWDYSDESYYFITMRIHCEKELLGTIKNSKIQLSKYGYIVRRSWQQLSNYQGQCHYDAFIVMPDHIHAIIFIKEKRRAMQSIDSKSPVRAIHESPQRALSSNSRITRTTNASRDERRQMLLSKIIGRFKMQSAKSINIVRSTPGHQIWQRNYYDHIIRNNTSLDRIRYYIAANPANWKRR